jgi:hypothetical protein
MDQNQLTTFVKQLSKSPNTVDKLEKILRGSAQTLQLLKDVQEAPVEKKEEIRETFLAQQKAMANDYDNLLSEMGLTKEMLEQYAADPKNFSPESWDFLESFKKEMDSELPVLNQDEKAKGPKKGKKKLTNKKAWMSA